VNQESFSRAIPNAVSLKQISGIEFNLESLLKIVIDCLQFRINLLLQGKLNQMDMDYLNALYRYQQLYDYFFKGKKIRARITGVNRYGQLILETTGAQTIECDLKEIVFI
jgi:BirA family biotin operon repressor/biotin-[acetyl-CoA-carboxylase] ligase